MDNTKKGKILSLYFLLIFVVFPFGQIFRYELLIRQIRLVFNPFDLISFFSVFLVFYFKPKNTPIDNLIKNCFYVIIFSLIYSLSIFPVEKIIVGVLYAFRLGIYYFLYRLFYDFSKSSKKPFLLLNSLKISITFAAMFGWVQYFLYPDLRNFTVWGWDDHLYRLVGTYLDPGFMGILMVFGVLLTFTDWLKYYKKQDLALSIFFILSLAFTYSRASYLALIGGVFVILFIRKEIKKIILFTFVFIVSLLFLPRPDGSGVQLERVFSIVDRLENYQQTLMVWKSSPIFGVGYNNFCSAREMFFANSSLTSHSCYGADSSILFILATCGIVGLLIFTHNFITFVNFIRRRKETYYLFAFIISLLIHSQFNNSFFYPWVMVSLGVIVATYINAKTER